MSKKIAILAGEASGDLTGAILARALKNKKPEIDIFGTGGHKMKNAGVRLIYDTTSLGLIGIWESLGKIPVLFQMMNNLKKMLVRENPDVVVFVDTPSLNLRLARFAKSMGFKTIYYFPPSAWSTEVERVRNIARCVDKIVPVFSFTEETYKKAGIETAYFGHPLVDILDGIPKGEDILKELNFVNVNPVIGILPGSRIQEIRTLLPPMLKAAAKIKEALPGAEFILPAALPVFESYIKEKIKDSPVPVHLVSGRAQEVMKVSRILIMASGSASLEAACFQTPMILLYKLSKPDWFLINLLVKIPYAGLPNLILQKKVVPELLQNQVTPEAISSLAIELLKDDEKRKAMIADLKNVREKLGSCGVVEKVANLVLETVGGK
ncbi:MAG: lipid-A-disaccharide synthase [Firmicutes bacterium]|nr:lipid-A-disaccharide synthase [Bacillota bacterium]